MFISLSSPVTACLDCTVWGIPVFSTCETEQRCAPCEPGEFAAQAGATECIECAAGKQSFDQFISKTELANQMADANPLEQMTMFGGSTGCLDCIAGRYGGETGELLCNSCKGNKYVGESRSPFEQKARSFSLLVL